MAIKPDFEPCTACGVNNSHAASRCRSCNTVLSWAKGAAAMPTTPATAPQLQQSGTVHHQFVSQATPKASSLQHQSGGQGTQFYAGSLSDRVMTPPSQHISNWNWGAIGVQLFGGAIFLAGAFLWCGNVLGFYPTFPGAGYITLLIGGVAWRIGAAM